jgi:hypothetical protein
MKVMRAVARWCLPILFLAAMLCAHDLTTTADAVGVSTIAGADAATPSTTSGDETALSPQPPAQVPFWCIGPGAVVVMSITKAAHSRSECTAGHSASSVAIRAAAPSISAGHPTPQGHAIPLLI